MVTRSEFQCPWQRSITVTRERQAGWNHNPLTPFDREDVIRARLKRAIEFGPERERMTQREVEKRSGVLQTKLNEFLQGNTKRLRRSDIRGLARALEVPMQWLLGHEHGLPLVHWQRGTDSLQFPYDQPPVAHLAQYRFIHGCLRAFRRDLKRKHGANLAQTLYPKWESPFAGAFHALIDIEDARAEYLDCNEGWPELTHEEFDHLTIARVDEMEIILRPWLEGKQPLDYDALAKRTEVIAGFPEADW